MKRRKNPKSKFWKPLTPSAKLAAVVGQGPVTRTEMVSKLWQYIRRHKLQDSRNRRMIHADEDLRPVFRGRSQVNMFEMTRLAHRELSRGGTDDPGPSVHTKHAKR